MVCGKQRKQKKPSFYRLDRIYGVCFDTGKGMLLGTATKMFTIADPVIVYRLRASVVYGVIYWIWVSFFYPTRNLTSNNSHPG